MEGPRGSDIRKILLQFFQLNTKNVKLYYHHVKKVWKCAVYIEIKYQMNVN